MLTNETSGTAGNIISRPISKLPEDPKQLVIVLQKILTDHYKDIGTLFAMTTDCDMVEKIQGDR